MNSKSSKEKRSIYENEFIEFLLKIIGDAGGQIQFQHITGYMSQLKLEVRNAVGTSMLDLKQFLSEHPNLFCLDNNMVKLANPSTFTTTSGYDSDNSSNEPETKLPHLIEEGKGIIVKLFPAYGFIKSKQPIKTEIFFRAKHCGDPTFDLTSFLYLGANVYFDAKFSSNTNGCNYSATRVQKADNSTAAENAIKQKSRKNRETGLYDGINLEGEGIIQKVFPNLGFIAVNGDNTNTVFFHKKRVVNYDNIVDLTTFLSVGDTVEFQAHRSTKPEATARWEATKVTLYKSSKIKQNTSVTDDSQYKNKKSLSKQYVSTVGNKMKEMKKDEPGKICPRSHGAVIKFGKNELADGDSALYFVCGNQVTEISWEFSEGEDVKFDAVKIKSAPGWKALLVWIGEKPNIVLPTCLGDFSEFTDDEGGEISSSVYTSKSSSCLSLNSYSSLKSASLKSESISSKKRDSQNLKKEKVSETPLDKKGRDYKSSKVQPSPSNLPSFSMKYQDWRKHDKNYPQDKFVSKVSNWGDSPYPDDAVEDMGPSKQNVSSISPVQNVRHNAIKGNEVSDEENELICSNSDNEEFEKNNSNEFSNSELSSNIDDYKEENVKEAACIKKFWNIDGKIAKVYSKFAEVKSNNLQKNVSLFFNDFFVDGMSLEQLVVADLKEVLKVGDAINFNYFVIVDDSGQSWQKVSLAWKGCKPKRIPVEMTPEDFIKQNNLSVTICEKSDVAEIQDETPSRKFLTSFIEVDPDQRNEKNEIICSNSDNEEFDEKNYSNEFSNSKLSSNINDCKEENLKEAACIKKFWSINGKITKVYSKFAEVKSNNLQISFFLNDFYVNGLPLEELMVDDLKEVLEIGDDISFNYFLIVDDSGQMWQKVTLAWKDCEPKRIPIEMSPEDFIKQNNLSVTICKKSDIAEIKVDETPSRKFLTSFIDVDPDKRDELSKTKFYTEDDKSLFSVSNSKGEHCKTILIPDLTELSNIVCEILKKEVFSIDSKVDLYSVSEEIVNIILGNEKKFDTNSSTILSQAGSSTETVSNICLNCREKCNSFQCQNLIRKDCEVQTIITGEIIAQNVFTEC